MARDTAGTMLQSFEAVKQAVGLDIPQMIKDVSTGGLVGRQAKREETQENLEKTEKNGCDRKSMTGHNEGGMALLVKIEIIDWEKTTCQ